MNERISKLDEQISKLKAQKQAILNRNKSKERKARTKRLIETGAIVEKYFGITSTAEAEALGKVIVGDSQLYKSVKKQITEMATKIVEIRQKEEEGVNHEVEARDAEPNN